jgi:flagellar motility protein MotE (MotC chaperone)
MPRPRLLPFALLAMLALLGVKLEGLRHGSTPSVALVSSAAASAPVPSPQVPPPQVPPPPPRQALEIRVPPAPDAVAERAVLEALRARRAEIEAREAALAQREMLVAAVERRLTGRLEELAALQQRLEAEARSRNERTEQGWRQMVRLYEGMRPRDAAGIFDDLDMPVLIQVVDRMREAKAAPVLAAMRPERARLVTTELARHRSRPND